MLQCMVLVLLLICFDFGCECPCVMQRDVHKQSYALHHSECLSVADVCACARWAKHRSRCVEASFGALLKLRCCATLLLIVSACQTSGVYRLPTLNGLLKQVISCYSTPHWPECDVCSEVAANNNSGWQHTRLSYISARSKGGCLESVHLFQGIKSTIGNYFFKTVARPFR